ncbi:integrase [Gossypium australe]|uniref:Integrase n=1 Tax=Gossypium australe TaxID=47621 RepID=A0A5B6VM07_9ROSI|nr:integrase [Gossypium australe]
MFDMLKASSRASGTLRNGLVYLDSGVEILPFSLKKKDTIWVVVDRLTKFAHLIPVRTDFSLERLAELYVSEIIRLHGVPLLIISDHDPRYRFIFWGNLHKALALN